MTTHAPPRGARRVLPRLAARIDASLLAPAPPERLAALRILVGVFALGYLVVRAPHLARFGEFHEARFEPTGVVTALEAPLGAAVVAALVVAAVVTAVPFVLGWRHRLTGPAFALLLLWVTTYRNSWGQVFHTENLVVLHVLVLAFAPAADAWSLDARRRGPVEPRPAHGWPVLLMAAITIATYFVAGWAKVVNGGWAWATGETLRHQVAFDNVRKAVLGDAHSPIGGFAVRFGWPFPVMAWLSLLVELGAPLALLGRRLRAIWSVAAWGFHLGILALMAIVFPYPLLGVAFAPLFRVERLLRRAGSVAGLTHRRRTSSHRPAANFVR